MDLVDRQISQLLAGISSEEVARGASGTISDRYKNIAYLLSGTAPRLLLSKTAAEATGRVALTQAIGDVRASLPSYARSSGNVATAKIEIDGLPSTMAASSKIEKPSSVVVGKGGENFSALNLGDKIDRTGDSEYKILDNIADMLGKNSSATGRVTVVTERPACDSCLDVARQFRIRYPNVELTIYNNQGVALFPKGPYLTKDFNPNNVGSRH